MRLDLGTYNIKPPKRDLDPGKDTFICGSEGVCYVQDIGKDVKDLRIGQQRMFSLKYEKNVVTYADVFKSSCAQNKWGRGRHTKFLARKL